MGARDGVDRKSESRPATAPSLVGAREALERTRQDVRRETRAFVAHSQLDSAVAALGLETDGSTPVAQGVVDEIAERLLEAKPVADELLVRCKAPKG